jgi:hypothetical protein
MTEQLYKRVLEEPLPYELEPFALYSYRDRGNLDLQPKYLTNQDPKLGCVVDGSILRLILWLYRRVPDSKNKPTYTLQKIRLYGGTEGYPKTPDSFTIYKGNTLDTAIYSDVIRLETGAYNEIDLSGIAEFDQGISSMVLELQTSEHDYVSVGELMLLGARKLDESIRDVKGN